MPSAQDVVDAINDVSGAHPGYRAAHAKGILCAGSFTASPAAARISRAAHLQGEPVQTTVRFSNGSGDPTRSDGANDGRGLAVKFYLPDGSRTDIVAITLPLFFVRTPEDFLAFTRVRKPDPETGQPDLEKVGAFLAEHPEAGPAIPRSTAPLSSSARRGRILNPPSRPREGRRYPRRLQRGCPRIRWPRPAARRSNSARAWRCLRAP